ncbi:putative RNA methyltransferase [Marinomonas mediterranea]|uniref:rRNA (Guanine-N(1)-)-methyltransferase n=1 Tax=Marinomonas mediterranea (strain ATCC 700492 / JCM 21426 / NBRC 103028 / MMB-1) TaxID=717774 RepID=F2JVT9_MARM1|nr:methyltransferase domain-containing protein [Marinomonas mediterranea]ADZ91725.1 rRNA (guanine-N(1)-)-methyltransferase [Marinomonas mediterranea MMB-1]WCN17821.1 methyltransferase domain-containing protein [Marinomonas mediterranea MMB-1]
MTLFNNLVCPLDQEELEQDGRSLRCPDGHVYDIAKSGYVNLLPVQKKHSKDPGDSKEMVASRKQFLDTDAYLPIIESLHSFFLNGQATHSVLDAGCGDGYYLSKLIEANQANEKSVAGFECTGIDISKWAIISASKRTKAVSWVVASNANIPSKNECYDSVLCAFGFPVFSEFHRVLSPSGKLVLVESGPNHLIELRKILYPTIKDYRQTYSSGIEGFQCDQEKKVTFEFQLESQEAIARLLSMTPHMHKAPYEGRQKVYELDRLTLTADVVIRSFTKC